MRNDLCGNEMTITVPDTATIGSVMFTYNSWTALGYDVTILHSDCETLRQEVEEARQRVLNQKFPRASFRVRHEGRIARLQRKEPRNGSIYLEWNRKLKWQPRFFSAPSRKQHFSQSRLRLSQVQLLGRSTTQRLHKACSLDWSAL
ncbi:hypothetical protein D3C80_829560 [compost metagenome]